MRSLQTQKPIPALFNTFVKLNNTFLSQIIGRDGSTANILFYNKKTNLYTNFYNQDTLRFSELLEG